MKRKLILSIMLTCISIFSLGIISAQGETYGDLTYTLSYDGVTITDCSEYAYSISIPAEIDGYPVTSISNGAFAFCQNLYSVEIPYSVTYIGDDAFRWCTNLSSVNIPYGVTHIGEEAFYWCTNLSSVKIPYSVSYIGDGAFYKCYCIYNVYYYGTEDEWNDIYIGYDNEYLHEAQFHFITSGTYGDFTYVFDRGNATITDCSSSETSISIPAEINGYPVTTIGDEAFAECENLTSVDIPDSIITIGDGAFSYCHSLTSVTIPYGLNLIGNQAFAECENLTSVDISYGVTSIGDYAFYNCVSLTDVNIPDSVTRIGEGTFSYCESLTSVDIPYGVTTICDYTFSNCHSLTSVNIPYGVTRIGKEAFYNCHSLTSIKIPYGVTTISNEAFAECYSLTSVEIPYGVTTIGTYAFSGCERITDVYYYATEDDWSNISIGYDNDYLKNAQIHFITSGTYGDLTYVSDNGHVTITDCNESATSVSIPSKINGYPVTTIGDEAFFDCYNLTRVYIPESINHIGDYAFVNCHSLTSVNIPYGVTTIGNEAFTACSNLTSIYIPDSVTHISNRAFSFCTSLTSVDIPDGVTTMGDYAFSGCERLTNVHIPDTITSIGDYAFSGCASLTSIDIPDGVTTIGNGTFFSCKNLTLVDIPDSVTYIGDYAFYNCASLTDVYYYGTKDDWSNIEIGGDNECLNNAYLHCITTGTYGDLTYLFDNDYATVTDCNSYATSISIPAEINGCTVTAIGDYAFYNCDNLTSVEIPYGVTTIGDYAFSGSYRLTDVYIPYSVTTIGNRAFYNCDNLTSVDIPYGVTTIGDGAFAECYSLTSVSIPDSVTTIGNEAFFYCESLTSVDIPYGITTISNGAFYNCNSLTSVDIPYGVTTIGDYAFEYCASLTSVSIPDSVTSIGNWAFDGCGRLTNVYYSGTEYDWNSISIGYGNSRFYYVQFHYLTSGTYGDLTYFYDNGYVTITACSSSATSVSIPDVIKGCPVTTISDKAFYCCYNLYYVDIPYTVSYIGDYAFYNCQKLTWAHIPSDVTYIGDSAFYNCVNLTDVYIPDSITSIGDRAFYYCKSLPDVYIPGNITSIGDYAFYNCASLTDVYYYGTKSAWNNIQIGENNNSLNNAKLHCMLVCVTLIDDEYGEQFHTLYTGEAIDFSYIYDIPKGYQMSAYLDPAHTQEYDQATPITEDITLYIKLTPKTYTVTFTGDYQETQTIEHGKDAVIPVAPEGCIYEFYVDGKEWDGKNITDNVTVTVVSEPIYYTVTFTGDYKGTQTVEHGKDAVIPVAPEGCIYEFYVDGKEWDGKNITDNVIVSVVSELIFYTVTFTGDYQETQTVAHGKDAVLPVAPEGYEYIFNANIQDWSHKNITSDVTVTVRMAQKTYTITYTGAIDKTDHLVCHGIDATLPIPPAGSIYKFYVDGEEWDGKNITDNVTVTVVSEPIYYTVTFTGDYKETQTIEHGKDAVLPVAPEGCIYEFYADGKEWDGKNITDNVTVTVVSEPIYYTVTFIGDYKGTQTVEHGKDAVLPVAPEGYDYIFFANSQGWSHKNITSDVTVTVRMAQKAYTITYTGAIDKTDHLVFHGSDVTLPKPPAGCIYKFYVDGEEWDGKNITDNVTVTVVKELIYYTVTFTGAISESQSVTYGTNLTLPTPPEGYVYRFTSEGKTWFGTNITKDCTVTVTKLCDIADIKSMNLTDCEITQDAIRGIFYNQTYVPMPVLGENATYEIRPDISFTNTVNDITLTPGENVFWIKVIAESGREKYYTVTVNRDIPTSLGSLTVLRTIGENIEFRTENKITANPDLRIYYGTSQNSLDYEVIPVFSPETQTLYVGNLPQDTTLYFKAEADYGDVVAESEIVMERTGITLSSDCYILRTITPPGGYVTHGGDGEMGAISNLRVTNKFDSIAIDVEVSKGATWNLYKTATATKPVTDNLMTLVAGRNNNAYIRVTSQDGAHTRTYKIIVYRQSKSTPPAISHENGVVTISAVENSTVIYTTDGTAPTEINGTVYTGPFSAEPGSKISAICKQKDKDEYSDAVTVTLSEIVKTCISEIYIYEANDNLLEYEFYVESPSTVSGDFIVSAYNGNRFVGFNSQPVTISEDSVLGTVETTESADNYKAFIWQSLMSAKPISNSTSGEIY